MLSFPFLFRQHSMVNYFNHSLTYTTIFLTPLLLAPPWLNPTLHLYPCSKHSSPILMLSLETSFKHAFSYLLLLWVPQLVTILLLVSCSALTHPSFTNSTHPECPALLLAALLRCFSLPSFLTSLLTSVLSLFSIRLPLSPTPPKETQEEQPDKNEPAEHIASSFRFLSCCVTVGQSFHFSGSQLPP